MSAAQPLLALKVDVDTYRGTREGVPRLAALLSRRGAGATFLFSVGPDHTGRALRRVFRPGFLSKVSRTSVLEHYGLRTLLYGTLLPGPHIGRTCAAEMRAVRNDGFEVGLHAYDHVKWQDFVASRDEEWTEREMRRGVDAFIEVFGDAPRVHGAAGWQMNDAAFGAQVRLGFDYASDTRGREPFEPEVSDGAAACAQVPTTLPTLDELIGVDGATPRDAVSRLLELTAQPPATGHVYTLHAELEGGRLLPFFQMLLDGWTAQGYRFASLRQLLDTVRSAGALPSRRIAQAAIPGRSGLVSLEGAPGATRS
ncbi:MAG: polysaccharide deacetylase [Betaproteobacteria bacterium]|nr:polysaccharide deacetylase [Betaproteobacteria bacterium]